MYRYENGHKIKENKYNETDNTILQRKQWQYEGNRLISVVTKSYDANGTVQEYEKQSYSNGKLAEGYKESKNGICVRKGERTVCLEQNLCHKEYLCRWPVTV